MCVCLRKRNNLEYFVKSLPALCVEKLCNVVIFSTIDTVFSVLRQICTKDKNFMLFVRDSDNHEFRRVELRVAHGHFEAYT